MDEKVELLKIYASIEAEEKDLKRNISCIDKECNEYRVAIGKNGDLANQSSE